jgi:hypothetical protein
MKTPPENGGGQGKNCSEEVLEVTEEGEVGFHRAEI